MLYGAETFIITSFYTKIYLLLMRRMPYFSILITLSFPYLSSHKINFFFVYLSISWLNTGVWDFYICGYTSEDGFSINHKN